MDKNKEKIITLFNENVRGKKPVAKGNMRHDGKYGHWLESQMGIKPNSKNEPDIFGYEMKNGTSSGKTTFGDWSANYYIFKDPKSPIKDKNEFLLTFGKANPRKKGRYSWSGEPSPTIKKYNSFGQLLAVDGGNNLIAKYSYSKDKRKDKKTIVPQKLQVENLTIAKWNALSMRTKLERKFNQNGWFKCVLGVGGVYDSIVFGAPINFNTWIGLVQKGIVYFDSGMYQGNNRNYSQWRANNNFWDSCITDKH